MKIGRNAPCPCGSGKKYKNCCWKKENIDIPNERFTISGKLGKVYPIIKDLNSDLLKKANIPDYEGANFLDAITLTITSNSLSLIKNIIMHNQYSITAVLNLRDIIECCALLIMYQKGGISQTQLSLFPEQYKLIEYYSYVKNNHLLYEGFADLDELTKSYNEAFAKFREAGLSAKDIKAIAKTRIPFLCNKKINYNKILEQYCPELLYGYGQISLLVHPSSYEIKPNTNTLDAIIAIIEDYLIDITKNISAGKSASFRLEEKIIFSWNINTEDNYPLRLKNLTIRQCDELDKLSIELTSIFSGENYISHFLGVVSPVIKDIVSDTILGYSENVKLKFKVIAELFACFNKIYFEFFKSKMPEYTPFMAKQYDICKLFQSNEKEIPTEIKAEIIKTFHNEFSDSKITDEQLWENFLKPLGFLIDKNGHIPTYTNLVKEYFNILYNDAKACNPYCDKPEILTRDFLSMVYKESNNMSHGCGYLFFANTGAWMDDIAVLQFTDAAIFHTLQRLYVVFACLSNEHEKNESVAQKLKKTLNSLNTIIYQKVEIYKKPKVTKPC